jgi:hypothetical protein
LSFQDFLDGLQRLREPLPSNRILDDDEQEAIKALEALPTIDAKSLARFIEKYPAGVPLLASCVGLSIEQLKGELKYRFDTAGWIVLSRKKADEVIAEFDAEFDLVETVRQQRAKNWNFTDVLIERRIWSQRKASSSLQTGRRLEDAVQKILQEFDTPFEMRTRFIGRGDRSAPCDFAVPEGGEKAQIVGAVKGFDSTGSKLTDAVREVEDMANVRKPTQFVYAIVDGLGWHRRKKDLSRIYRLRESGMIDGLYSISSINEFKSDFGDARKRLGGI